MLKLTVSPGEFLMIGEDIKIIFCGGEKNNIPIAVEAPRDKNIIRSSAVKKCGFANIDQQPKPYIEKPLSDEAKKKVTAIVAEDRWRRRHLAEPGPAKDELSAGQFCGINETDRREG